MEVTRATGTGMEIRFSIRPCVKTMVGRSVWEDLAVWYAPYYCLGNKGWDRYCSLVGLDSSPGMIWPINVM